MAREIDGGFFVNGNGKWVPAGNNLYDEVRKQASVPTDTWPKVTFDSFQWKVIFHNKFGFPPNQITVLVDGESGQIASVSPDFQAELTGGVVAAFQSGGSTFHVFTTNPDTIEQLFSLQRGESLATIPNGSLRPGPGPGLHNTPWSWHLNPQDIHMAEVTIEVCDGTPDLVEQGLEFWLNTVGRYCPWSAKLVDVEDFR